MARVVEDKASGAASAVELVAGRVSNRVMLFPIGRIQPKDTREPWILEDRAHAQQVVDATIALMGRRDFMIDYDHQAVHATRPEVGGRAAAAGWASTANITAEDDGIYADVEWTAAARSALRDREYRYLSPHFGFDKKTRRLTRLYNAALVNIPAFEMAAVAAQSHGDHDMMNIALALGLGADADEDSIVSAIDGLKAGASLTAIATALKLEETASAEEIATAAAAAAERPEPVDLAPLATALGLEGDQTVEQLATAATSAKASAFDPAKFVPMETHQLLIGKVAKIDEDRATAAVDAAIEAGKIAPASRDWGLDLFKTNEASFTTFVSTTPTILQPGETEADKRAIAAAGEITDEERAICASLNITPEAYLETKKELA